jgi:transcriptional regulator with XRE-family HTH domain
MKSKYVYIMIEIYKILGDKVRDRRIELDLTQETLAEMSGLHRTYIAGIEKGKRNISLKNLEKLAVALDIELNKLLIR